MALYRSPVSNDLLLCHDQPPYYVRGTWKPIFGHKFWVKKSLKEAIFKGISFGYQGDYNSAWNGIFPTILVKIQVKS